MRTLLLGLIAFGLIPSLSWADQATVDSLTSVAKEGCLVGTQFTFTTSADGSMSFRNPLKPGANGQVTVDLRKGKGAVSYFQEQLRLVADESIQKCMQPYVLRIFDYIVSHPNKETRNITGTPVGSHAGDDPADGPDATACAIAEPGWTIKPRSGTLVPEPGQPANGSFGVTHEEYTPQHYCVTFHIVRANRGRSAQATGHATAVQERDKT
jgi:hypothetical protein